MEDDQIKDLLYLYPSDMEGPLGLGGPPQQYFDYQCEKYIRRQAVRARNQKLDHNNYVYNKRIEARKYQKNKARKEKNKKALVVKVKKLEELLTKSGLEVPENIKPYEFVEGTFNRVPIWKNKDLKKRIKKLKKIKIEVI